MKSGLWKEVELSDPLIHECAPMPRALFEQGKMKVWRLSSEALRSRLLFGGRETHWVIKSVANTSLGSIGCEISEISCWAAQSGTGYVAVDLKLSCAGAQASSPIGVADFLDALHHIRFMKRGASLVATVQVDPRSDKGEPAPLAITPDLRWTKDPEMQGRYSVTLPIQALVGWLFALVTDRDERERVEASLENPTTLHAYAFVDVCSVQGRDASESARVVLVNHVGEMAHARRALQRNPSTGDCPAGVRVFEYSHGAFFTMSPECTAFIAIDQDDSEFWQTTMPHHMMREYFSIQILTMYQRHVVDEIRRLAGLRIKGSETPTREEDQEWEQIQQIAIAAKAHAFFIEVSMRTNHARFEKVLRETMHVDRAFDLAMSLVDSLCETQIAGIEMRREKKLRFWQGVAGATILPTLGLTVMNVNMIGWTTATEGLSLWWVIAWTLGLGGVGWMLSARAASRMRSP